MFKGLFRRTRKDRAPVEEAAFELVPRADAESGRGFVLRRVSDGLLIPWGELEEVGADLSAFQVDRVDQRSDILQDPRFAPGSLLQLIPESSHPDDPNAVAVWDIGQKHRVGYVPSDRAPEIKRALRSGERLLCLTLWEELDGDRRVALRALLVGDSVSLRSVR